MAMHGEKGYTISKFSKMLGVSTDTLRHYERCGLLKPTVNPVNGYRLYSDWDALTVFSIRMYRGLNMPIPMITKRMSTGNVNEEERWMNREIHKIDNEIARLQFLRSRCTARLDAIERSRNVTDEITELKLPPAFQLYYSDFTDIQHAGEMMQRWTAGMPMVGFMFLLDYQEIISGGEIHPKLGLGARLRNVEAFDLPIDPPVRMFYGGIGLRRQFQTTDPFSIGMAELAPMLAYARARGRDIETDAVFIIDACNNYSGTPVFSIDLHFQTKEVTNNDES